MTVRKRALGDVVTGAVLLLFSAAAGTQVPRIQTVESRFMPLFALGCISVCAVWLIIRAAALGRSDGQKLGYRVRELAVWAMMAAFWALINVLGFYTAALLFLFVCQLFLWGKPTRRSALISLAYAVIAAAAMYLCFTVLLKMALPRGALI